MKTLEELQKEQKALEEQLKYNLEQQRVFCVKNFIDRYDGITVGDIVKFKANTKEYKKAIIDSFEFAGVYPYLYRIRIFNNNNMPSKAITKLYPDMATTMILLEKAKK